MEERNQASTMTMTEQKEVTVPEGKEVRGHEGRREDEIDPWMSVTKAAIVGTGVTAKKELGFIWFGFSARYYTSRIHRPLQKGEPGLVETYI